MMDDFYIQLMILITLSIGVAGVISMLVDNWKLDEYESIGKKVDW